MIYWITFIVLLFFNGFYTLIGLSTGKLDEKQGLILFIMIYIFSTTIVFLEVLVDIKKELESKRGGE